MKNGKFEKSDLKELNEIYNYNGSMTCGEFRVFVDKIIYKANNPQTNADKWLFEFWSIVLDSLSSTGTLFLYDVRDRNGYMVINDIMKTLHYDNGEPLSGDDYNYFDHYDRDQDLWGFYEDTLIDHFELDKNGNLIYVVVMTKEELTDTLTYWYDGSSWDHDFGN